MNGLKKWPVGWALLWTLVVLVIQVVGQVILYLVFTRMSWDGGFLTVLSILPSLFCCLLTSLLVMRFNSSMWLESLRFLGLKKINLKQLWVALLALIPTAVGYFLGYFEYHREGVSLTPFQNWPVLGLTILITAGLFEEVFFRGFLFQMLRPGRSFFSAAAISSTLWALGHAIQGLGDFDANAMRVVGVTMLVAIFLGFALAYLFERGGNVLWGCMLMHFLFDSMAMVDVNHQGLLFCPAGLPAVHIFGGMGLTVLCTFALSMKLKA
jgi:membrane protease YdiL (CAAX protease family)